MLRHLSQRLKALAVNAQSSYGSLRVGFVLGAETSRRGHARSTNEWKGGPLYHTRKQEGKVR